MKDMCWVLHHLYPKCPADFFLFGSHKHSPWYVYVPLSPYRASGVSKPQAENEATRIPQPGAERGPELERQIIALVDFIGSKSLWRDIEDRKIPFVTGGRLSSIRNRQYITVGLWRKWQTARQDRSEIWRKKKICTSSSSLEKALSSASKYLPSESTDHGEPELHNAAKSSEFEQLTAGLIRERNIIGITDNQD